MKTYLILNENSLQQLDFYQNKKYNNTKQYKNTFKYLKYSFILCNIIFNTKLLCFIKIFIILYRTSRTDIK